jgi:hypothetical protein
VSRDAFASTDSTIAIFIAAPVVIGGALLFVILMGPSLGPRSRAIVAWFTRMALVSGAAVIFALQRHWWVAAAFTGFAISMAWPALTRLIRRASVRARGSEGLG